MKTVVLICLFAWSVSNRVYTAVVPPRKAEAKQPARMKSYTPPRNANGVGFTFGLMPKARATPEQIAAVKVGMHESDAERKLGEKTIYTSFETRDWQTTTRKYYPSLTVVIGPDKKVKSTEPPKKVEQ